MLAERRWLSTYERANLTIGEARQLNSAIGRLRTAPHLPLPGDGRVSMLPLVEIAYYSHNIDQTSLRLVYDFTDETLTLFSLHRR